MIKVIIISILMLPMHSEASRQKTVGDLLQQIDSRGAARSTARRSEVAVPQTRSVEAVVPKNLGSVKPIQTQRVVEDGRDTTELERVIDQSINELFSLTQRYRNSPNRGELWLRLGELYVEKGKLIEFRTYEEYDRQLNLYYEKQRRTQPRLDLSLSHDFYKKAIQLYEWFVRDFPQDRKVDQALFFLGYNHFQIGNQQQGARYFEELNRRFPRSRYVSESNFSLGEYYFENNNWAAAIRAYDKVIEKQDDKLLSLALYKKAWSLHRLNRTREAITHLERVISLAERGRRRIRLVVEAQNDLVTFYSTVGNFRNARSYFSRYIDRADLEGALEKLAFIYVDIGNREAARFMFNDLIASNPNNRKALDYKFQIVNAYSTAGERRIFFEELNDFLSRFAPNTPWARANQGALSESETLRESFLRTHSLQNHQVYSKSKSRVALAAAIEGYKLYLQYFPSGSNLDEINFFYAELLFDQENFQEAAQRYNWVVRNAPESKYYDKALNNSLIALEKGLPEEKSIRAQIGDSIQKVALPTSVVTFIAASNNYLKNYSEPTRKAEVLFRTGRLYYLFNHFDEAEKIFQEVIANYPRTEHASFSANLILDIYNLKQDYAGLEKAGMALLANPALANSPALKDVSNVVERASYKRAQDLEDAKNYASAAREFQLFSERHPRSSLALNARFNAGVNYERAGNNLLALAMYSQITRTRENRSREEVRNALLLQANIFQKIGRYTDAARSYELYARENPKDPNVADIHFNAATLWDGLNNITRAVANYEAYYRLSAKRDKGEAYFRIAQMFLNQNKYREAIPHLVRFTNERNVSADLLAQAFFELADAYEKTNDLRRANQWYNETFNKYRRVGGRATRYAAESKLRLTLQDFKKYEAIQLPANPNQQERVLNQKIESLNKLNESFTEIIRMNSGPQIISSLVWLGRSFEHFADSIEGAPKPSGLSEDDLKAYEEGIKQITDPKRKTGIDFYKQSLSKSRELDIYDESTAIAYKALSRYEPTRYLPSQDFVFEKALLEVKQ